jgi:hypothetical protein
MVGMKMPNYVVFDSNNKYHNYIICEEDFVVPEGFTKQLVDEQHYWDEKKQEILVNKYAPLKIENI